MVGIILRFQEYQRPGENKITLALHLQRALRLQEGTYSGSFHRFRMSHYRHLLRNTPRSQQQKYSHGDLRNFATMPPQAQGKGHRNAGQYADEIAAVERIGLPLG